MTDFQFWSLILQAVGLVIVPLIAVWGIWRMEKNAKRRDEMWKDQHDESMKARDIHHETHMTSLMALIRGQEALIKGQEALIKQTT